MENQHILFKPKEGKLRQLYPELNENKKFKDLNQEELYFAWLYGCASSPIPPELTDAIRAKTAAAEAIKSDKKLRERYANMEFSEKMKEAVEEMQKYNPDVRMVAKRITQNNFRVLEKMSQTNVEDFKYQDGVDLEGNPVMKIDFSGYKQFVDMVAKTADTMPTLIAQMEQGFGVVDTKGNDATEKIIDVYHSRKES